MLPVVAAWSSSDVLTIRYVFPVLWMTSCFHVMGPMGQNQARFCFEEVRQVAVPVGRQTASVVGVHQNAATGEEGRSLLSTIDLFAFCDWKKAFMHLWSSRF